MNPSLLIDAIVRQTVVLIGQLATSAGLRAPLTSVADRVFLELVRELSAQGVRQKVVADMFGMALRTYQKKVQRLTQSESQLDHSIWEALYSHIARAGTIRRFDLFRAFPRDDEPTMRGILKDMVESRLVFASGTGPGMTYRVASPEDLERMSSDDDADHAMFVWATIYRLGPSTFDEILTATRLEGVALRRALDELIADGRIQATAPPQSGSAPLYRTDQFVIPLGSSVGWGTAVLDHFQAVVRTIASKLSGDDPESLYPGRASGSTWTFDVWPGHPYEEELLALLTEIRERVIPLQEKVFSFNKAAGRLARHARMTFYLGQSFTEVRNEPESAGDP